MRKIVLLGLLLPFAVATARAGSFAVNPVRLQLSAVQPTAVLHVTNNGKTSTVVQLSLFTWSQTNGKNVLTPTRKLLATPPIFTLPAGGKQIVRVGLLAKPAAHGETAYRLFMTQVPPRPRPGFRGLQVALRMSLPVFVAPRIGTATPKLVWRIQRLGNGKVKLTVINNGTAHAQMSDLTLAASATGPALARPTTGNGYVLPGTSRSWELKLKSRAKHGQMWVLRGKSRQGSFSERLGPGQ
jgi:fimbrial chaperone protein